MLRRDVIAAVAGTAGLAIAGRAAATAPTPPYELVEAGAALDALRPFLGAWEGEERFTAEGTTFRTAVYRQLIRPSGAGSILSLCYRADHLSALDTIIYAPKAREYRLLRPGIHESDKGPLPDAEFPMRFEPPNRLSWTVVEFELHTETSVVIADGEWRERQGAPGLAGSVSEAVLRRSKTPRVTFPS